MTRIIKACFLLALAFVGWRVAQPRLRAYEFANAIKDEVESKQIRPSPTELRKRIFEMAESYGLNLNDGDDDVAVSTLESGSYEVKVHYDVPVDLGFYIYQQHFDFVSRTRSGALPK